jgi:hypothetical protein
MIDFREEKSMEVCSATKMKLCLIIVLREYFISSKYSKSIHAPSLPVVGK